MRAQERYSRNDSVLIVNPSFNARTSKKVTYDTLKFFDDFLGVKLRVDSIKACHIIPNTETEYKMSTVICKFFYFNDKLEVFKKKRALRKAKNHIDNKNIYLNESLPENDAQIKAEAVKRKTIVSTHNCTVSGLIDRVSQKPTYKEINDVEDLDNVLAEKKNTYNASPTTKTMMIIIRLLTKSRTQDKTDNDKNFIISEVLVKLNNFC